MRDAIVAVWEWAIVAVAFVGFGLVAVLLEPRAFFDALWESVTGG